MGDCHVTPWLARIASVVAAQKLYEGVSALAKHFRPIPQKANVFWDTWTERGSWVKVYPDSVLH